MAFKIVFVLAAIVACAQAGGPAAYSISAPSIDHGSVGNTQENTVKGHYGQNSQSDYSSSVTAGHAVSHVSRSSTTNDAVGYAPSYGGHVVAAAAPIAHAISSPVITQSYAPAISHGYAAASPVLSHGYAAASPILSHGYAAAAPVLSHGYAATAPAISTSYLSAAPSLSHGILSSGLSGLSGISGLTGLAGLSHSYAAPAISSYISSAPTAVKVSAAPAYSTGYLSAAPAYSHSYVASAPTALKIASAPTLSYASNVGLAGHGLGLGLAAAHYAAPAYAAPAYGAPILKAAVAAPALVHTSVAGHGVHYAY